MTFSVLFSHARACTVVGLGAAVMVGTPACASTATNRDAMYTQLPAPDGAPIEERDGHLIDDHGDLHVHGADKLDPPGDVHAKAGDLSSEGDEAAAKIRDR